MEWITGLISAVYQLLWGDLFVLPLPGGGTLGISLLVILLIPTGIYFTIRTRFLPIRLFPEMLRVTAEKRGRGKKNDAISGVQALVVSTASRRWAWGTWWVWWQPFQQVVQSGILDVALGAGGVLHCLYRGHARPAVPPERPSVRRLPGRSGLLHSRF